MTEEIPQRDPDECHLMSDTITIYRCTECGKESVSVGWLHAHIEAKHTGFGPFNLIPNPFALGNFDRDMAMTEVLRATDPERVTIDEVDDVG